MEAICAEKLIVSQILKNIYRILYKPVESTSRPSVLYVQDTFLKRKKLYITVGRLPLLTETGVLEKPDVSSKIEELAR